MDIYCPVRKCGEPIDMDYLHDVAEEQDRTYSEVRSDFQTRGCEALGMTHSEHDDDATMLRAEVMSAMYDLLGDDLDGAAAMMEDFGY